MKTLEEILGEDSQKQFLPKHFARLPFSLPKKSIPKNLGYKEEKSTVELNVTLEEGDFLSSHQAGGVYQTLSLISQNIFPVRI